MSRARARPACAFRPACAAAAAAAPPPCELRGTPPASRRTPRTMPASSGSIEPLPSVISRPPPSTKRCSSARPLQPMPPVMSSDSAGVPKLGVVAVFLNGIGPRLVGCPEFARPAPDPHGRRAAHRTCAQIPGADVLVANICHKECAAGRGSSGPSRWCRCPPMAPRGRAAARRRRAARPAAPRSALANSSPRSPTAVS